MSDVETAGDMQTITVEIEPVLITMIVLDNLAGLM
jgi:hypothetical protein